MFLAASPPLAGAGGWIIFNSSIFSVMISITKLILPKITSSRPKTGFCFGHIVPQFVGKRLQIFVVVIIIHSAKGYSSTPPTPASGGDKTYQFPCCIGK
jgi:hypothetical protein